MDLGVGCSDVSEAFKHQFLLKCSDVQISCGRPILEPEESIPFVTTWAQPPWGTNVIKSESRQDTWEASGDTFMSFLELKAHSEGWEVWLPQPLGLVGGWREGVGASSLHALAPGRRCCTEPSPPTFQPHESPIIHAWCQQGRALQPSAAGSLSWGAHLAQNHQAPGWHCFLSLWGLAVPFWDIGAWPWLGQNGKGGNYFCPCGNSGPQWAADRPKWEFVTELYFRSPGLPCCCLSSCWGDAGYWGDILVRTGTRWVAWELWWLQLSSQSGDQKVQSTSRDASLPQRAARRMGGQAENSRGRQRTELTLFSPLAIQMLTDFIRIFSCRAKSFFIVPSKARCQMQAAVSAAVTQPQGSHIPVQTAQSSTQDFAGKRLKHPLRPPNRQYWACFSQGFDKTWPQRQLSLRVRGTGIRQHCYHSLLPRDCRQARPGLSISALPQGGGAGPGVAFLQAEFSVFMACLEPVPHLSFFSPQWRLAHL